MAAVSAGSGPGPDPLVTRSRSASQSSSGSSTSASTHLTFVTASSSQAEPDVTNSPTTLTRFLFAEQTGNSCSADLAELIHSIQCAIKAVNAELRFGNLSGGKRRTQEKAERIFIKFIHSSYPACMLLTPNSQIPIPTQSDSEKKGKYAVCLLPFEGPFYGLQPPLFAGTIFGIHKVAESRGSNGSKSSLRSPLLPGRQLVAAGYALYGIATTFVLTLGRKSNLFTLDPALGEFVLSGPPLAMPPKGNLYNVDEGHIYDWDPAIIDYIEGKKDPKHGRMYCSQHLGCIIADVHSILLQGGICMLPKVRSQQNGRPSVLLCLAPLAYIVCAAGGLASNGEVAILDICPESTTQTAAAFLGSREDVRELLNCLRRHKLKTKAHEVRSVLSTTTSSIHLEIKHEPGPIDPNTDTVRSQPWRPETCHSKEQTAPVGRSHLTIAAPTPTSGCGVKSMKMGQTTLPATNGNNALAPVTPLTTVRNDHVRLTWPAFGNLLRNSSQNSTRKA